MRRIRHDQFIAMRLAARLVISTNHRHAGELTLRTRHGRQRHGIHAGDVFEHFLQFIHAGEEALPG